METRRALGVRGRGPFLAKGGQGGGRAPERLHPRRAARRARQGDPGVDLGSHAEVVIRAFGATERWRTLTKCSILAGPRTTIPQEHSMSRYAALSLVALIALAGCASTA